MQAPPPLPPQPGLPVIVAVQLPSYPIGTLSCISLTLVTLLSVQYSIRFPSTSLPQCPSRCRTRIPRCSVPYAVPNQVISPRLPPFGLRRPTTPQLDACDSSVSSTVANESWSCQPGARHAGLTLRAKSEEKIPRTNEAMDERQPRCMVHHDHIDALRAEGAQRTGPATESESEQRSQLRARHGGL